MFPLAAQAIPRVRFPSLDSHFTKSRDTLRIFVIGDVMMHQAQIDADYEPFFRYIRPEMEKADICIANMEFSLGGEPYSGYPAFSAPDAFARYVKDCGVDVFLIANNHIPDRGMAGLRRTVSFYRDSLQIPYAGVDDEPLMLVRKDIRLGLVNFTYGTNNRLKTREPHISLMREEGIHNAVDSARRAGADFLIALPHWGVEYVLTHSQQQEKFARFLVSEGFDAVVGERGTEIVGTGMGRAAGMTTNNYYDVRIDADRIKELDDIVRVAQSERRLRRMGYSTGR